MKTNLRLFTLLSVLAITSGCGKSGTGAKTGDAPTLPPTINPVVEDRVCSFVLPARAIGDAFSTYFDISLRPDTVERVLSEMKSDKLMDTDTFWVDLSEETRDLLNHELNMLMINHRPLNTISVYQSTALYFTRIKNSFSKTTDYKVRDYLNGVFSFKLKGQETDKIELIGTDCQRPSVTDLSFVYLPPSVFKIAELKQMYFCKTKNAEFNLMEIRDNIFIQVNQELFKTELSDLKKEESSRQLLLTMQSQSVQMELNIRKKRKFEMGEFEGKRTRIELKVPSLSIEELGACDSLKDTL